MSDDANLARYVLAIMDQIISTLSGGAKMSLLADLMGIRGVCKATNGDA